MPEDKPAGPAPAPAPGAPKGLVTSQPPRPPFWSESFFWYGVLVLGTFFLGMLMGWSIPAVDLPSGGGGGGGYSSGGGRSSYGGK
jgi:hypothetical protein